VDWPVLGQTAYLRHGAPAEAPETAGGRKQPASRLPDGPLF
jgi:hypothetical protein